MLRWVHVQKISITMKTKRISAAFMQNLEVFASKNAKFKSFLRDINLNVSIF